MDSILKKTNDKVIFYSAHKQSKDIFRKAKKKCADIKDNKERYQCLKNAKIKSLQVEKNIIEDLSAQHVKKDSCKCSEEGPCKCKVTIKNKLDKLENKIKKMNNKNRQLPERTSFIKEHIKSSPRNLKSLKKRREF